MSVPDSPGRSSDTSAQAAILRFISGFMASQALYVITKLGIPDLLKEGPKDSKELAQATGTHAASLYRVLRALASVGVVAQDETGRFASTSLGLPLQTGVPGSLRAWVLVTLGGEHYQAWGDLMHSVRSGEIAFNHVFGTDVWSYRAGHPGHAKMFDEAMASLTGMRDETVARSYPFATVTKIVDVGGGDGTLAIALLRANPSMTGMVFDLPHVAEKARKNIAAAGLADRCEVVDGDALTSVPGGGDVYILSRIIHDWDDEQAATILRNCRRAMREQSKLLMIDRVLPPHIEHSDAGAFLADLNMMVMNGGRERTEAEFRALCESAGLQLARVVPTGTAGMIIEAIPSGSSPARAAGI